MRLRSGPCAKHRRQENHIRSHRVPLADLFPKALDEPCRSIWPIQIAGKVQWGKITPRREGRGKQGRKDFLSGKVASAAKLAGDERRAEVLETLHADDMHALRLRKATDIHALRHKITWLDRAEGRDHRHVVVAVSAVGKALFFCQDKESLQRVAHGVCAHDGVRVACGQTIKAGEGRGKAGSVRQKAKNVDCASPNGQNAGTARDDKNLFTVSRRKDCGHEPRQAAAGHDKIEITHSRLRRY